MAILQGARITGSIIATTFIKAAGFSGSLTASNLYVLGKAGIGTSSPAAKLDIRQTSAATGLKVFTNDTSTAYIAQFIGYDNSLGETTRMVVQAGGSVGIGTTSPSNTKLHILGDWVSGHSTAKIQTITSFASGGTSGIGLYDSDGTRSGYLYSYSTGTSVGSSNATPLIFETNGTERMRITSDGKVGIGTSSPNNRLDVVGGTGTTFNMSNDSDSLRGGKLTFISSSATGRQFYVGTTSAIYNLVFGIDSVERARIDTAGNLGIGTTSPAQKLDVRGYIVSDVNSNAAEGGFYLGNSGHGLRRPSASNDVYLYTTSGTLYLGTTGNSSQQITLLNGGNVGIGTTSPNNRLEVVGSSFNRATFKATANVQTGIQIIRTGGVSNTDWEIYSPASTTDLRFYNGSDLLTFKTNGNVGIGTTSPAYKLDVNGVGRFIGNIALITDASSNDYSLIGHYYSGSIKAFSGYSGGSAIYGGEAGIPTSFQAGGQSAIRILTNGNVGIGTTSPGYTLEVNGTQRVVGNFYLFNTVVNPASNFANQRGVGFEASTGKLEVAASGSNALSIGRFGSTGQILDFRYAGTQIGNFSLDTNDLTLATARHLILSPTGNVGIGTSSPAAKLQVNVNSVTGVRINGTGGFANIISQGGHLEFYKDSTPTYAAAIGLSTPATALSNDIQFATYNGSSWSARMTIQNGGNVGIGTTSPVNKLHVSGSSTNLPLKLEGLTSNATGYFLTVDNTTGVVYKSTSGASGTSGTSGANGSPGTSGTSGTSGANGSPGTSGTSGTSGANGSPGTSGSSGTSSIKAWVHFDGGGTSGTSGISPNASNNVSSITDNGTGDYTVNFTTAFANANYVVAGTATFEYENPGQSINNMFIAVPRRPSAQTTTSCRIVTPGYDNVLYDCKYVRVLFSN